MPRDFISSKKLKEIGSHGWAQHLWLNVEKMQSKEILCPRFSFHVLLLSPPLLSAVFNMWLLPDSKNNQPYLSHSQYYFHIVMTRRPSKYTLMENRYILAHGFESFCPSSREGVECRAEQFIARWRDYWEIREMTRSNKPSSISAMAHLSKFHPSSQCFPQSPKKCPIIWGSIHCPKHAPEENTVDLKP